MCVMCVYVVCVMYGKYVCSVCTVYCMYPSPRVKMHDLAACWDFKLESPPAQDIGTRNSRTSSAVFNDVLEDIR